jgi:FkbM family methyltransferase
LHARRHATPSAAVDDRNPRYDAQTLEVIRRVLGPADSAVDVGANVGSILTAIVAQAPQGRHHAFEPIPALAARLRIEFPGVVVHEAALAAEAGRAEFHHVVSNESYSGLRERRYDRPHEEVELISVAVERLDDAIPTDLDVRFVKIDVEGGELGVLQGGVELLRRCRPFVVLEHGLGGSDYYGTGPVQVYEVLAECGLRMTLLERWLDGRPDLTFEEVVDEFESGRNYYFLAHPD